MQHCLVTSMVCINMSCHCQYDRTRYYCVDLVAWKDTVKCSATADWIRLNLFFCRIEISIIIIISISSSDNNNDNIIIINNNNNNNNRMWQCCSHTGNILRFAKCATGRKCCSGRVCEKDDQVQYSLRHSLTWFFPMAVETLGPLSDEVHSLITEIGRRVTLCTADSRETMFLCQRIFVAIQRFNAVCFANTFTVSESPS